MSLAEPKFDLRLGDCLSVMRDMPSDSVDLFVTSPPYDNRRTYEGSLDDWSFEKFAAIAGEMTRLLKPGGVIVWIVNDATINGSETGSSFRQALHFKDQCGLRLHDTMIWNKGMSNAPAAVRYISTFEFMFVFSKDSPSSFNPIKDRKNKTAGAKIHGTKRLPDGRTIPNPRSGKITQEYGMRFAVWEMPSVCSNIERSGHPAPFPENLARDHIISWSDEGMTVCDPFLGSGTTGVAALKLGRNFIGMERVAEYYEIAKDRVSETIQQFEATQCP